MFLGLEVEGAVLRVENASSVVASPDRNQRVRLVTPRHGATLEVCHDLVVLRDGAIFDAVDLQCSIFAQGGESRRVRRRKLAEPNLVPIPLQRQVALVWQDGERALVLMQECDVHVLVVILALAQLVILRVLHQRLEAIVGQDRCLVHFFLKSFQKFLPAIDPGARPEAIGRVYLGLLIL